MTTSTLPIIYRKGQQVTMLFHMYGLTSEEEYTIVAVHKDGSITLDTDEDPAKRFRFDTHTGRCLNDNTWGGCRRELKVPRRDIHRSDLPLDPAPDADDEI